MTIREYKSWDVFCVSCGDKLFKNWRTDSWDQGRLLGGRPGTFKDRDEMKSGCAEAGWHLGYGRAACPTCTPKVVRTYDIDGFRFESDWLTKTLSCLIVPPYWDGGGVEMQRAWAKFCELDSAAYMEFFDIDPIELHEED